MRTDSLLAPDHHAAAPGRYGLPHRQLLTARTRRLGGWRYALYALIAFLVIDAARSLPL